MEKMQRTEKRPRKFACMNICLKRMDSWPQMKERMEEIVMTIGGETLSVTWQTVDTDFGNRMRCWIALVAKSAKGEEFDVEGFLRDLFGG